jgi:glucose/arabinose dehydrogenase
VIRVASALAALALAGCGQGRAQRPAATTPAATATPQSSAKLPRPPCREGIEGCASTSGTIVYVERVDPDGDGDLHVVVTDRRGVTLTGLTAIDVAKELRPRRDPRIGEHAAAMGPVEQGSHGQSQIQALVFRTRR